jgi:hypothetical protein
MRAHHRTDRVLSGSELMPGAPAPADRAALIAAVVVLDQGARLPPPNLSRSPFSSAIGRWGCP